MKGKEEIVEDITFPAELLPGIDNYSKERNLDSMEEAIVAILQREYEKEMRERESLK